MAGASVGLAGTGVAVAGASVGSAGTGVGVEGTGVGVALSVLGLAAVATTLASNVAVTVGVGAGLVAVDSLVAAGVAGEGVVEPPHAVRTNARAIASAHNGNRRFMAPPFSV